MCNGQGGLWIHRNDAAQVGGYNRQSVGISHLSHHWRVSERKCGICRARRYGLEIYFEHLPSSSAEADIGRQREDDAHMAIGRKVGVDVHGSVRRVWTKGRAG